MAEATGTGVIARRRRLLRDRGPAFRYGFTVGLILFVLLTKWLFPSIGQEKPFLLLGALVAASAWFGGLGPALLATSAATIGFLFGFGTTFGRGDGLWLAAGIFWLESAMIIRFTTALQRSETERQRQAKLHASEMRETEQVFRLLVQSVTEYAIFLLDPAGRVASWNLGAQRIFGYDPEEISGRHFSAFYDDEQRAGDVPARELRSAAESGSFREHGWRLRKDGSKFWAEVSCTALRDDAGKLWGFAKITRDMTEQRAHEEKIRGLNLELEKKVEERTAHLVTLNRELEAFSYSVSHDLRAPLRGIDGFSKILLEKHGPQLNEQAQQYLKRIRAATMRMAGLIDDLLKLSRLSRMEMREEELDLAELARDIVEELRQREPDRQVEVQTVAAAPAKGDPQLLRVVLENLLGNAWKFTRNEALAKIEFGIESEAGEPVYFVRDNGAGFEMDYATKLFAPFQRLHDQSEFEGSGVGLATVQRVVTRHGGRVWGEGKPGEGAVFRFTLKGIPQ